MSTVRLCDIEVVQAMTPTACLSFYLGYTGPVCVFPSFAVFNSVRVKAPEKAGGWHLPTRQPTVMPHSTCRPCTCHDATGQVRLGFTKAVISC